MDWRRKNETVNANYAAAFRDATASTTSLHMDRIPYVQGMAMDNTPLYDVTSNVNYSNAVMYVNADHYRSRMTRVHGLTSQERVIFGDLYDPVTIQTAMQTQCSVSHGSCLVGWDSMAIFHREPRTNPFEAKKPFKVASFTSFTTGGQGVISTQMPRIDEDISKITTFRVQSCTVFSVVSENDILFAHVDAKNLSLLYRAVMGMKFKSGARVFASRMDDKEEGSVEAKIIQTMIEHIKPDTGFVVDRGVSLTHRELGLTVAERDDTTVFDFQGDILEGEFDLLAQAYNTTGFIGITEL